MGDLIDQPEFDRERDEFARPLDVAVAVAPAQQRLEPDHVVGADVHLGLERAVELPVADGEAQALLALHARGDRLPHVEVEKARAALHAVLGPVHGGVGVAPQRLVVVPVLGIEAHADRGRGEYLESVDQERLLEVFNDRFDLRDHLLAALRRIEDENELVAAHAREDIRAAQMRCDALHKFHQQRVADGVAVEIVDVLEIVDVDEGKREAPVAARENGFDALADEAAVGQPGQFVVVGEPQQLVFRARALGDVEGAAQAQRLAAHLRGAGCNQEGARAIRSRGILDERDRRRRAHIAGKLRRRGVGEDHASVRIVDPHTDRKKIDHGMEQIEPLLCVVQRRGFTGGARCRRRVTVGHCPRL